MHAAIRHAWQLRLEGPPDHVITHLWLHQSHITRMLVACVKCFHCLWACSFFGFLGVAGRVLYKEWPYVYVQWSEDVIKADPFFGRSRVRFRVPPCFERNCT